MKLSDSQQPEQQGNFATKVAREKLREVYLFEGITRQQQIRVPCFLFIYLIHHFVNN